jgi:hypothetical protein
MMGDEGNGSGLSKGGGKFSGQYNQKIDTI